jgi:hypothetical protein
MYERTIGVCPGLALALQHYAELLKINRTSEAKALLARAKELQVTLRSFN